MFTSQKLLQKLIYHMMEPFYDGTFCSSGFICQHWMIGVTKTTSTHPLKSLYLIISCSCMFHQWIKGVCFFWVVFFYLEPYDMWTGGITT